MPLTLSPMVWVLLSGATTLMAASALVISAIIGEVNRRLPEDQQISYLWGYPGKLTRIKEHYKQFYPNGNLLRILRVLIVLTVILMVGVAFRFALDSGFANSLLPR